MALLVRSSLATDATINVRLVTAAYGEAMKAAYGALTKPLKPAAIAPTIRGMARVFKAADLDLRRANLFAATFATGEGVELVQRFIAEQTTGGEEKTRAEVQNETTALKAFNDLQASLKTLEIDKPTEAIARYRRFNDERPQLPAVAGVLVAAAVARLHLSLKEPDTALAIYDWALQRYGTGPASMGIVMDRARLLAGKEDIGLAAVNVVWPRDVRAAV